MIVMSIVSVLSIIVTQVHTLMSDLAGQSL